MPGLKSHLACALPHFYTQRPAVREGIVFLARTIVQRTMPGQRQTVKTEEHMCHVYVKADNNLAGVVVADSQVCKCSNNKNGGVVS